eukprot:gnl/MRDRNA2_/MRDRNA2_14549_c0_seq1.p1 gnl/MRDRNA2_/MRDRNA2_14549_c0~~gnl/MRDRNA2_/MRDRNA2_14549_c0_seq1.p1  ORF type:complete len:215 (-),score=56.02 gnl/MRDRNA2_/MRDRNA2_14549_c0_seq1:43-627(-)
MTAINKDGHTPLMLGFFLMYQQPEEAKVRAVMTLAQMAGAKHVADVEAKVHQELSNKLHNSQDLVNAALDGNLDKAKSELQDFADPNSKDKSGTCALIAAAHNGNIEAIKLLFGFKADLQSKNENGASALGIAIRQRQKGAVQILLDCQQEVGLILAGAKEGWIAGATIEDCKEVGFIHSCADAKGAGYSAADC